MCVPVSAACIPVSAACIPSFTGWRADLWSAGLHEGLHEGLLRLQVRLYSLASGLSSDGPAAAVSAHRMPAKLSSLAWCPDGAPGVVTVGDYDGDVTQIDLNTGHHVADVDGHGGRRCAVQKQSDAWRLYDSITAPLQQCICTGTSLIAAVHLQLTEVLSHRHDHSAYLLDRVWSVAHSKLRRNLCASASDDGTAALWSGVGLSGRAAPPLTPARGRPVTCVDFSAEDENALLVACANGAAYVYDLRNRYAAVDVATVAPQHRVTLSYWHAIQLSTSLLSCVCSNVS